MMVMNNEKNTLDVEKALRQLKSSYDMYEKTKKETEKRMKDALLPDGTKKYSQDDIKSQLELISNAQKDIIEQYLLLGGNEDDLKKKTRRKSITTTENMAKTVQEMMVDMENDRKEALEKAVSATATRLEQEYIPAKGSYSPMWILLRK